MCKIEGDVNGLFSIREMMPIVDRRRDTPKGEERHGRQVLRFTMSADYTSRRWTNKSEYWKEDKIDVEPSYVSLGVSSVLSEAKRWQTIGRFVRTQ